MIVRGNSAQSLGGLQSLLSLLSDPKKTQAALADLRSWTDRHNAAAESFRVVKEEAEAALAQVAARERAVAVHESHLADREQAFAEDVARRSKDIALAEKQVAEEQKQIAALRSTYESKLAQFKQLVS